MISATRRARLPASLPRFRRKRRRSAGTSSACPVETNDEARRIMEHAARGVLHFSMDLAFLIRRKEKWHVALEKILFEDGDIVELAEQAEDAVEDWPSALAEGL